MIKCKFWEKKTWNWSLSWKRLRDQLNKDLDSWFRKTRNYPYNCSLWNVKSNKEMTLRHKCLQAIKRVYIRSTKDRFNSSKNKFTPWDSKLATKKKEIRWQVNNWTRNLKWRTGILSTWLLRTESWRINWSVLMRKKINLEMRWLAWNTDAQLSWERIILSNRPLRNWRLSCSISKMKLQDLSFRAIRIIWFRKRTRSL